MTTFDEPPQRQEHVAAAQKSPIASGIMRRNSAVFNTAVKTSALSRVKMRTMVKIHSRMSQTHILTPCDPPTN